MRFDAQELVDAWKATGAYPRIHDDIFNVAVSELRGVRVLDLCCSTGLLTHRVACALKVNVLGIDGNKAALERGEAAGLLREPVHLQIGRSTITQLLELISARGITAVLARRCMPELFGSDLDLGREFAGGLRDAGVDELVLEGRVATSAAVNPLASIDDEVRLFAPCFAGAHHRLRSVALLRGS